MATADSQPSGMSVTAKAADDTRLAWLELIVDFAVAQGIDRLNTERSVDVEDRDIDGPLAGVADPKLRELAGAYAHIAGSARGAARPVVSVALA